ncbi:MAG: carbamoyltransferase [Acidobacteria bacterium]|nr:carbamoyltransferase [Acidobacteriota bacterium]
MNILGINAYHGDASAVLVVDGRLVAAAEEERFNRVKHWAGLPVEAVRDCLESAGLSLTDVDRIAVSRDPSAHLHEKILFALSTRPSFGLIKDRLANAARVRSVSAPLAAALGVPLDAVHAAEDRVEHHRAHMASAFFVSPFDRAACLSIDGFGDFVSAMWGVGRGTSIQVDGHVPFPHSVGIFYTAVTQYLGFLNYGDEYKVMGLAPYGQPEYLDEFRKIVRANGNGFRLDLDYFLHHSDGVSMVWDAGAPVIGRVYSDAFVNRFGPAREPGGALDSRHANVAASLQALTEEIYFHLLNHLHARTRLPALCLAGGVAYNSVANGKIRANTRFEDVYIQPAAGDAGTAVGAAFSAWHQASGHERGFVMRHAAWGSEYSDADIASAIVERRADLASLGGAVRCAQDEAQLCDLTAQAIADGKIVGWFQGRMEWGARALGQRSILADPRRAGMKDLLNARIKRREPFRPFCPSILREHVDEYFEGALADPFMISVYPIRPDRRAAIPAVTHVDGTGRLQAVSRDDNPLYWSLIDAFRRRTGVPVVLNTSFNENEPIVRTPAEALDCFIRTRMNVLVMGQRIVERTENTNG